MEERVKNWSEPVSWEVCGEPAPIKEDHCAQPEHSHLKVEVPELLSGHGVHMWGNCWHKANCQR